MTKLRKWWARWRLGRWIRKPQEPNVLEGQGERKPLTREEVERMLRG